MSNYTPFYTVNSDLGNLGNFGSLVRFIDDWDKHVNSKPQNGSRSGQQAQQQQQRVARRNALPTFTPRFDVQETEQAFELHGELPGVDKANVQIEFTEPQTIVIKGSVERTYSSGTPPSGLLDSTSMSGAITHESHEEDAQGHSAFQPTVEDEKEGESGTNNTVAKSQSKPSGSSPQEPKSKYWVYERNVGSFQRTFTFSSRVDQDNVHATLENGILHVVVPKAKKPESRRITVH